MALDEFSDFQAALPVSTNNSFNRSSAVFSSNLSTRSPRTLGNILHEEKSKSKNSNGFGFGQFKPAFDLSNSGGGSLLDHGNSGTNPTSGVSVSYNNAFGCLSPSILLPTPVTGTSINKIGIATSNQPLSEDRYSALRELSLQDDLSTCNNETVSNWSCDWSTTLTPNDVPSPLAPIVSKPEKVLQADTSNDSEFGEFQSFSTPNPSRTHMATFQLNQNSTSNGIFQDFNPPGWNIDVPLKPVASNSGSSVSISKPMSQTADTDSSDEEFGNFVGFTLPNLNESVKASFDSPIQPIQTQPKTTMCPIKNPGFTKPRSNSVTSQLQPNPVTFIRPSSANTIAGASSFASDLVDVFSCVSNKETSSVMQTAFQEKNENLPYTSSTSTTSGLGFDDIVNKLKSKAMDSKCSMDNEYECSHTDYKVKTTEISPETRSVASLDLGNYVADTAEASKYIMNVLQPTPQLDAFNILEPIDSQKNESYFNATISSNFSLNGGLLEAKTIESKNELSSPVKKFECFKEESDGERERCIYEWTCCLEKCKEIIQHAVNLFNSLSCSEVIREILSSEKGHSYVSNLTKVYLVACRIKRTWTNMGEHGRVGTISREINFMWESLSQFFLGTSIMEELIAVQEWRDEGSCDISRLCGVCLRSTTEDSSDSLIDYGGKFYHCACANFWVNQVDPILPSLTYFSST